MRNDKKSRWLIIFVCVAMSAFTSSCNDQSTMKYSSTTAKRFETEAGLKVRISSFHGDVQVRSGDKDQVQVVTMLRSSKEEDLEGINVDCVHEGHELLIEAQNPSSLQFVSASFEIVLPSSTELLIETAGDIRISGIMGGIDAYAAAGNLEVSWSSGEIKAQASGDVFIVDSTGNIFVETSRDLEIHDSTGFVHARIAHDITIEGFNGQVNIQGGSGEVNFSGELHGKNNIELGSGDINLNIQGSPNLRVDLVTGEGFVDVFWQVIGRVNETRVLGRIGEGDEGTLVIRTGSGNILISEKQLLSTDITLGAATTGNSLGQTISS